MIWTINKCIIITSLGLFISGLWKLEFLSSNGDAGECGWGTDVERYIGLLLTQCPALRPASQSNLAPRHTQTTWQETTLHALDPCTISMPMNSSTGEKWIYADASGPLCWTCKTAWLQHTKDERSFQHNNPHGIELFENINIWAYCATLPLIAMMELAVANYIWKSATRELISEPPTSHSVPQEQLQNDKEHLPDQEQNIAPSDIELERNAKEDIHGIVNVSIQENSLLNDTRDLIEDNICNETKYTQCGKDKHADIATPVCNTVQSQERDTILYENESLEFINADNIEPVVIELEHADIEQCTDILQDGFSDFYPSKRIYGTAWDDPDVIPVTASISLHNEDSDWSDLDPDSFNPNDLDPDRFDPFVYDNYDSDEDDSIKDLPLEKEWDIPLLEQGIVHRWQCISCLDERDSLVTDRKTIIRNQQNMDPKYDSAMDILIQNPNLQQNSESSMRLKSTCALSNRIEHEEIDSIIKYPHGVRSADYDNSEKVSLNHISEAYFEIVCTKQLCGCDTYLKSSLSGKPSSETETSGATKGGEVYNNWPRREQRKDGSHDHHQYGGNDTHLEISSSQGACFSNSIEMHKDIDQNTASTLSYVKSGHGLNRLPQKMEWLYTGIKERLESIMKIHRSGEASRELLTIYGIHMDTDKEAFQSLMLQSSASEIQNLPAHRSAMKPFQTSQEYGDGIRQEEQVGGFVERHILEVVQHEPSSDHHASIVYLASHVSKASPDLPPHHRSVLMMRIKNHHLEIENRSERDADSPIWSGARLLMRKARENISPPLEAGIRLVRAAGDNITSPLRAGSAGASALARSTYSRLLERF